ncbi:DNA adenine methylase [Campylobacter helveticus]|uniref:DNA adenine methylase n=1 Tax=Campylobacter helveticus TaxID=28898 RepID=UPI00214A5033|nr:DNA adenine methylase [Campylobacter helveticus]
MKSLNLDFVENKPMQIKPFLKWAGGKRALSAFIMPFVPKYFKAYFEPFLGGGALFFTLYQKGFLKDNVILNDKNKELINSYEVLKNSPSELFKILENLQNNHTKEHFYKIRNLDRDKKFANEDSIFRAARFIYLNKTCFNGLCRYNAKGEFNTPLGSYKNPKIYEKEVLLNASLALQRVRIYNDDFERICGEAKKDDFIYFDPPYYPLNKTSSFVSYTDVFLEQEQIRLAKLFKELDSKGVKVLQSNSNTPFIRELYKGFEIIELKAKRAINCKGNGRGEITELLIKGNYE